MGSCLNKGDQTAVDRNKTIEQQLVIEKSLRKKHIKLLLLGAGECGKTTVLKQMKILHNNGFSEEETMEQKAAIYSNIVTSMCTLLQAMQQLNIMLEHVTNEKYARVILDCMEANEQSEPITPEIVTAVKQLWADSGVQEAFERRAEFQLTDSSRHFFNSVERVGEAGYRPTELDILHVRIKTTGINEIHFVIKKLTFRVFDVGGQRSERRKWIHCFDDVNGIIFISAVNEYDQVLVEDEKANRLIESLRLFESICNSVWFAMTAIILFLNKTDLFKEKILKVPLNVCFDYNGAQDYDLCLSYIEDKFLLANRQENKQIFIHRTCATDTNQLQLVLDNVLDMLIHKNVEGCGLA